MPQIIKKSTFENSFRNQSIIGQFDLQVQNEIIEEFNFDLNLSSEWKLGVIVGNSGTGKTTIAKDIFNFQIDTIEKPNKSVLDLFDSSLSLEEITKTLTLIGFASPKSWLKPYYCLSNGEKMRVDLALELLSNKDKIVFDEFTSVVDRDVAVTMCQVINKILKYTNKQIILVACHFDILNYLDTDWIFNTNNMELETVKKKDLSEKQKYINATEIFGECLASITI